MRRIHQQSVAAAAPHAFLLAGQQRPASSFFSRKTAKPNSASATASGAKGEEAGGKGDETPISSSAGPSTQQASPPSASGFVFKPLVDLRRGQQVAPTGSSSASDSRGTTATTTEEANTLKPQMERSFSSSSHNQPQTMRKRRTFARPVFADDEDAGQSGTMEQSAVDSRSATSSALSPTTMATAATSPTSASSSSRRLNADEQTLRPSEPLLPSSRPSASYEEAEAAILDHLGAKPAMTSRMAKRISQSERFNEAKLKQIVTDDDPILKVMEKDVPGADYEEFEIREMKDAARRERIRLEGTTGKGMDGALSGVSISDSDRISLFKDQREANAEELKDVSSPGGGAPLNADMLTREQKHLLWEDRKNTYSVIHRKMLIALESHHSEMDKLLLLIELHDAAIKQQLRVRAEVYVDIFATAFTALTTDGQTAAQNRNKITLLDELWTMYQYCVDSGTDPTPRLIQNMMRILSLQQTADGDVEAKAHRLMLDSDRFKLMPTTTCLSTYFAVCGANNSLHIAVARLVDARIRYEISPSTDMVYTIMEGFRRNKREDEGIAFLATIGNVPITMELFSSVIHVARASSHPLSAFTYYKALRGTDLRPDRRILTSLLIAMETADDYSNMRFLLSEILRYRVRLDFNPLNRLLIALTKSGPALESEFCKLYVMMRKTGKKVFEERLEPRYLDLARKFEARMKENELAKKAEAQQAMDRRRHSKLPAGAFPKTGSASSKPSLLSPTRYEDDVADDANGDDAHQYSARRVDHVEGSLRSPRRGMHAKVGGSSRPSPSSSSSHDEDAMDEKGRGRSSWRSSHSAAEERR